MTTTAKTEMYTRIERHGRTLLRLFPGAYPRDPVELCKRLRSIERAANADAVRYCNGDIDTDRWETVTQAYLGRVCRHLGLDPDNESVPIFINGDPRGYALKIHSEWTAKNAPDLHRDWGGYGIIAPDLSEPD